MSSRRLYITLNDEKEKDKVILNYLSNSYSESDAIKEALYRLATNCAEKVQKLPKRDKKIKKNTVPKSIEKVQNGANCIKKGDIIPKTICTEKVQKDTIIIQNEIDQLKEFI